jgi:hypothetical protein
VKVYLAAAFSRQQEIREVAERLTKAGISVTSRWLDNTISTNKSITGKQEDAFMDIRDLRDADILVRFTDDLSDPMIPSRLGSAARMFEFGMAWERGMPVIVVGGKQNVFDFLPNVIHVHNVSELGRQLGIWK